MKDLKNNTITDLQGVFSVIIFLGILANFLIAHRPLVSSILIILIILLSLINLLWLKRLKKKGTTRLK